MIVGDLVELKTIVIKEPGNVVGDKVYGLIVDKSKVMHQEGHKFKVLWCGGEENARTWIFSQSLKLVEKNKNE